MPTVADAPSMYSPKPTATPTAATAQIVAAVANAHCVITGGTNEELERQAARLGVAEHITFTGRVPHDDVQGLYSIADLMVYPRKSTRTTELTTPLKPLEAMAMAKPVLISDVNAMLEQMAGELPYLVGMMVEITHDDPDSTLGWCDDQTEFTFGLDLILEADIDDAG